MSRMPFNSINFDYGECSFCGVVNVEICPLSEIVTPTTYKEEQWICADCILDQYPEFS